MKKVVLCLILLLAVVSSVNAQSRFDVTIKDTIKSKKPYLQVKITNNDKLVIIHNSVIIEGNQLLNGPETYMQVVGNPGEKDCHVTGVVLFKDTYFDPKKRRIVIQDHATHYEEFPFLGQYVVWRNPFPEDADKKIRTLQLKLVIDYFDGKDEKFHNDTIYSNIIPWTAKP